MAKTEKSPEVTLIEENAKRELASFTSIAQVARFIAKNWPNVWFGAVPYLQAMAQGSTLDKNEPYIAEDQRSMVVYFLANANTWKGPVARVVKAWLNERYGYGGRR